MSVYDDDDSVDLFDPNDLVRETDSQKLETMKKYNSYKGPIKDSVVETAFKKFGLPTNGVNELITSNVAQVKKDLIELGHYTQQKLGRKAIIFSYANQAQAQTEDEDFQDIAE